MKILNDSRQWQGHENNSRERSGNTEQFSINCCWNNIAVTNSQRRNDYVPDRILAVFINKIKKCTEDRWNIRIAFLLDEVDEWAKDRCHREQHCRDEADLNVFEESLFYLFTWTTDRTRVKPARRKDLLYFASFPKRASLQILSDFELWWFVKSR